MYYVRNQCSRSVSGQTLPLRVKQTAVLLVPGDLGPVSKLKVFAPEPTVLKVMEKAGDEKLLPGTRRFEVTALKDADEVDVLAASDAAGMNVVDGVKFMILTAKESSEYYRNKMGEIARSLEGCHYVNGSAGAMPDMMNGMPSRPGKVYMYKPGCGALENDVMNSVAYCPQASFNSCAGGRRSSTRPSSYLSARPLTAEELRARRERNGEASAVRIPICRCLGTATDGFDHLTQVANQGYLFFHGLGNQGGALNRPRVIEPAL